MQRSDASRSTDPLAMPSFRLAERFIDGFAGDAGRKKGGSNKEITAFSGTVPDFGHLVVGATYCDVFTLRRGGLAVAG